jgi:micrococcal nuclease
MTLPALIITAMLAAVPLNAFLEAQGLRQGPRATVAGVVDGDTVVLESGKEVRLVGIMAPKLSLGRDWLADQPLSHEARAALAALVEGREVTLAYGGTRHDRHGRILAHLFLDDGTWVQGWMLEHGLARVYSFADNRGAVPAMLALEETARQDGLGIWAERFYAVRDAANPAGVPLDSFELVEGVVMDAAAVDRRIFLNFGQDWASDVTATISPADRGSFRATTLDPLALEGKRVRIRGWTSWRNGPSITVDHPEQIEILE